MQIEAVLQRAAEEGRSSVPINEKPQFTEAPGTETNADIHRTVSYCKGKSRNVELHAQTAN
jgi:hypothetical protein